ncbi:MAG: mannonate dehydratase, partial [Chloroflexi bacterium]|nr:mannonate dehydratase [Chloroflexota bacterium]
VAAVPEPSSNDKGYYSFETLLSARTKIEAFGLRYFNLRLLPWTWTYKWMMGLPGRDEQIENYLKSIRNAGAAGIPLITYNMHVLRYYRTSRNTPGRGGSMATSFDFELVKNAPLMSGGQGVDMDLVPASHRKPVTDQQMWSNLEYFLKAATSVAEEAGVKLALHPDDPPIPQIAGVARIMRSPEAFRKLLELVPSKSSGVAFCQGCFTEMGADIPAEIRYFGGRGKIFFVDFRNVIGKPDKFREAFPDEGQADLVAAMKAYKEVGFKGPMTPDHVVHIVGDSEWGHRYWAYAIGHIKGLAAAVGA